ncbi:MAG: Gfo/Idh/MocA family oxidoreductase, partial [Acetobacteraceae bacterium]|nr:Gfo/Idh/MocA family oxidoreductase [Acetobacteraceae bacterium]
MLGAAVFGTDGPATGEHVRAYQRCGHTRLVAVGSRPGDAALAYAREAGAADAFVSKDFEAVLQHPDVELISITAAPEQRAEMAVRAARAGKHVCIEAPMATTLAECRAVQAAVAEAGVCGMVFFRLRAHPVLAAAGDLVDQGALGVPGYLAVNCWEGPEPDARAAAICDAADALCRLRGRAGAMAEVFAHSGVLLCRFANGVAGRVG